jgi:uncharacterized membrane protein (DUF106 family)
MFDLMSLASSLAALDFSLLKEPPLSTLFILGISVAISLVTTIANRMVMDLDEYRRWMVESRHLQQELMDAMRSGNQRRIAKLQKQQQDMMKIQQKMMTNQWKTMLFTFVPFLLIWQVLTKFFSGVTIAYMPFKMPWIAPQGTLSLWTWYLFCSAFTSIILRRILGLSFEIEPKES